MRSVIEGRGKKSSNVRLAVEVGSLSLVVPWCTVAFKVYDMDRDGYISNGELFIVLKMMVGNNLKVRLLVIYCF